MHGEATSPEGDRRRAFPLRRYQLIVEPKHHPRCPSGDAPFGRGVGRVPSRPVAEGEKPVQAGAANDDAGAEIADDEGWPVLSDLELDVCLSDTVPGVTSPIPESGEA